MDSQESNLHTLFKSICPLVKKLDEHRSRAKSLLDLFAPEVTACRQQLLDLCEEAIFTDQDCVSTKPREILWRKGYYDAISVSKRFAHKHNKSYAALDGAAIDGAGELCAFIAEGTVRLKRIIVRMEKDYNLDLKYLVDFSLFENIIITDDKSQSPLPTEMAASDDDDDEKENKIPINKKITSLEIINFALESIHSLIVSLGDLHRYHLDFNLDREEFNPKITKQLTAQFYEAAFRLNPKNGMPQNQLGTLWIGRNYNLDSVYYYLYSLVCARPFELSEDNVVKIFQQSAAYLEQLVMPDDYLVTFRDFVARFMLIVDIFFFDKNVPTLNDLCRFLLCDLNWILRQKSEENGANQEVLFKLTAILFFCMRKLKRTNSPKVFQLNAFLAAICDQFVGTCNANFEEFFAEHADENEEYQRKYQEVYSRYLKKEELGKKGVPAEKKKIVEKREINGIKDHHGLSSTSTGVSQDAYVVGGSSNDGKSVENGKSSQSGKGNGHLAEKKRVMKYRRRRRRSTYSSDSDLTSNFDSDSEKSEEDDDEEDEDDDEEEDDEDFDSEDEEEQEENEMQRRVEKTRFNGNQRERRRRRTSSDEGEEEQNGKTEESDSDVVIEEEKIVVKTNGHVNGESSRFSPAHSQNEVVDELEENFERTLTMNNGGEDENSGENPVERDVKLKNKIAMAHYDPNLLIKFVNSEPTIRAIKILFDWLTDNKEIIWECYQSNPEFVHKIIELLNAVNLNIFTRKVFFERSLLTTDGLREDIRTLFDARAKLPIAEDLLLKHFAEFGRAQVNLDWEIYAQMKVTPMEENLLRIVKLKNFGFFICDRKKFGYAFRNVRFEQIDLEQAKRRRNAKKGERNGGRGGEENGGGGGRGGRPRNGWGSGSGSGSAVGETRKEKRRQRRQRMRMRNRREGNGDEEELEKGRMRNGGGNRQQRRQREEEKGDGRSNGERGGGGGSSREAELRKKGELMGKLWLRNEVKNLESKARKPKGMGLLTPYVVVDTKALVQHLAIVKHFVRMEKFIVLIPTEVLAELDSLKTMNERARECIRWLDRTISNGSPFLRTQEIRERLPIVDYQKPRHGARTEISSFLDIAEFCHFLSKKHEIAGQPGGDVLTLLTGEDLDHKEVTDCDYAGILRLIPIKFDRIDKFYGKLIKK